MSDPSNAGPYTVGVDGTLSPDVTEEIRFSEVQAGPQNKYGYLRKIFGDKGGTDYIFIVNASGELIEVETKSGSSFIPEATSQPLTNGPFRSVKITNVGANDINTGDTDRVKVMTGNNTRETGAPKFSPRRALKDMVPGF